MAVVTSYAYAVTLFELMILVIFTYLFVIHLEDDFEECTSFLSLQWWGGVSVITGYVVCISAFACALIKHIAECKYTGDLYPEMNSSSVDLMYSQSFKEGIRGSLKRVPKVVHGLALVHVLALVFFVVWSIVGIVVIVEDRSCMDKELYQVTAVWLTLTFLSLFMSFCCCFCACTGLFTDTVASFSKQNKITEYVQSFPKL